MWELCQVTFLNELKIKIVLASNVNSKSDYQTNNYYIDGRGLLYHFDSEFKIGQISKLGENTAGVSVQQRGQLENRQITLSSW